VKAVKTMRLSEAIVLFACIQGVLIALPESAPTTQSNVIVSKTKGDRLPVRSVGTSCASQTWPNLPAACLRGVGHAQSAIAVRLVTADRQTVETAAVQ
jgi:hypothetical protein